MLFYNSFKINERGKNMEQQILDAIESLTSEIGSIKSEIQKVVERLDAIEDSVLDNTRKIDRNYKELKSLCKVFEAEISDKAA